MPTPLTCPEMPKRRLRSGLRARASVMRCEKIHKGRELPHKGHRFWLHANALTGRVARQRTSNRETTVVCSAASLVRKSLTLKRRETTGNCRCATHIGHAMTHNARAQTVVRQRKMHKSQPQTRHGHA